MEYAIVNVGSLSKIKRIKNIDRNALIEAGLIRKNAKRIKILGYGKVDRAFNVEVDRFSEAAIEKIKSAGGEIVALGGTTDSAEERADE